MSALASLGEYSSESDECDDDIQNIHSSSNRKRLPLPDLSRVLVSAVPENHIDNPVLHAGRIRSFPHVRGDWATLVYIHYPDTEGIIKLINKLVETIPVASFERCDNLHVSLSKTLVLKYHWINSFTQSLQDIIQIQSNKSFELEFDSVKVYCNDEQTRTFVSLEAEHYSRKHLLNITKKIDEVLQTFRLPTFYSEPSFHLSILWTHGNKKEEICKEIETLNHVFLDEKLKCLFVDKINCKIGNKQYQFSLVD